MTQFKLNMPASLRERLEVAVEKTGRSMTAEIIARLQASFDSVDHFENAIENIDDLLTRVERLERSVYETDR
ncbi:Arc family DNA-binding protein [Salipiger abyssi]|uniref:Arc family DNA-binding protein n=1 Tax=Salipiger abyssi TaxID=1250539 RepID=UPI00405861AA